MNEIAQFECPCHYHDGRMYCTSGHLYVMEPGNQMATLATMEGVPLKCPACKGIGFILTPAGIQLIHMIWRHLEPPVAQLIEDLKSED